MLARPRIAAELPGLWRRIGASNVLDVPCGDFHWMRNVALDGIDYTGGDIVPELIERNRGSFGRDDVRFMVLNLTTDALPDCDLVFCRDCLVHLSYRDIWAALRVVADSRATYLLTTTFTACPANHDIQTGQWRPLNLQGPPFSLGPPHALLVEDCTEGEGVYSDKSLGLWQVDDLRTALKAMR